MKICLAVVGLARSFDICLPSRERNIFRSLGMAPGLEVSQSLTLSHSAKPLNNERTGENQAPTIDTEILGPKLATLYPLEQVREESTQGSLVLAWFAFCLPDQLGKPTRLETALNQFHEKRASEPSPVKA